MTLESIINMGMTATIFTLLFGIICLVICGVTIVIMELLEKPKKPVDDNEPTKFDVSG